MLLLSIRPRSSSHDLEIVLKSSCRIEKYVTVEDVTLRGTRSASIRKTSRFKLDRKRDAV